MIQPSEKYQSMQFWDELFKSKGFESLGYKGPFLGISIKMHWYRIPGIAGNFYIGMDDWYFRCGANPHFTIIWVEKQGSDPVVIARDFSYPGVWEFRLFLDALQDPRQTPVCFGMDWCSNVLSGITLPI